MITSHTQLKKELLYFTLASFVPFLFTNLWMFTNTQLPASDATDYLFTAYRMYHHFIDNGFWSGLFNLTAEKGWRPIFFPVLCVPFLFLSHGSVIFAYSAVAALSVLASAIYVYLLLRLQLDRFSAIIAANLIGFLPFVHMPVFTFAAECVLFPAIMGTLYHLIQSDYFLNKKHTSGFIFSLTLALVVRPIEAAIDLLFVIMIFILRGGYQKIFSLKQIVTFIGMSLLSLFLIFFSIGVYFIHQSPIKPIDGGIKLANILYISLITTLTALLITGSFLVILNVVPCLRNCDDKKERNRNNPPLIIVFGIVFSLVLLWFLPYAFQTFSWIYQTSFGSIADLSMKSIPKLSISDFIFQESAIIVFGVAITATLSFFMVQKNKIKEVISSSLFIYLLSFAPFALWEVLNTSQTESRKLSLAFPGFLMALLLIGLQHGKFFWLRMMTITSLFIAQLIYAFGILYPQIVPFNFGNSDLFGTYLKPITINPNPHDVVINFLDKQAKNYQLKDIVIEVSWRNPLPVYGYLLMMQCQMMNRPYQLFSYSDEMFQKINVNHDAVFLTDKQNDMVISKMASKNYYNKYINEINPALNNLYHFLYYYSENKLNDIGWKLGPCITMKASDNNDYLGCLLISLKKSFDSHTQTEK